MKEFEEVVEKSRLHYTGPIIREATIGYIKGKNKEKEIFNYMREYAKEIWNSAIEWSANNVEMTWSGNPYDKDTWQDVVDTDSILKGKII